jgi:hypothetical protein
VPLVHRTTHQGGKPVKRLLLLLLLSGCVTPEEDTRICADYGSYTLVKERCVPLYGALICVDEEVTETYCKRYFEEEE